MRNFARFGLVLVLLVACVGCDQVSKSVVRDHVALGESRSFLADTFRLTHVENPGAFLSLGASLSPETRFVVFQLCVSLLVLGLLYYALFARQITSWMAAGFALLAASGVGNLIDRLWRDGNVTDFLNIGIGSFRTGIFNVADVLGVLGFFLLVLRRAGTRS